MNKDSVIVGAVCIGIFHPCDGVATAGQRCNVRVGIVATEITVTRPVQCDDAANPGAVGIELLHIGAAVVVRVAVVVAGPGNDIAAVSQRRDLRHGFVVSTVSRRGVEHHLGGWGAGSVELLHVDVVVAGGLALPGHHVATAVQHGHLRAGVIRGALRNQWHGVANGNTRVIKALHVDTAAVDVPGHDIAAIGKRRDLRGDILRRSGPIKFHGCGYWATVSIEQLRIDAAVSAGAILAGPGHGIRPCIVNGRHTDDAVQRVGVSVGRA